jgi:hypothetical protein
MRKTFLIPLALLAALPLLPGCRAKKVYPDPEVGWHNPSHTVLFGTLQRIAAKNTEDPPVWTIRFGTPRDPFGGEFALTPPQRLTGYVGGETVEVRGAPRPDFAHPDYAGTWFEVRGIRLWSPHR